MTALDQIGAYVAASGRESVSGDLRQLLELHVVDTIGAWIASTWTSEGLSLLRFRARMQEDGPASGSLALDLATRCALARLSEPRRAPGLVLAGAGGGTLGGGRRFFADVRIWVGVLVVVGGILSIQYWQSVQHDRDIEETDAAILSSELPLEAYLDGGFQAWLKRSEP